MQSDTGVRSYPLKQAIERIGVGYVTGFKLAGSGELETFTIGCRRYVTEEALQRFIQKRVAESLNERPEDRARKVEKAVQGRARRREERQAA